MRGKRTLIGLLLLSLAVYVLYSVRVVERVGGVFGVFGQAEFWLFASASFALLMGGVLIRAYKYKRLLDPVKNSGTRTQVQALLIGYLFNTILPLRIGEFIRAYVLGRSLKMSVSLMFALIIIERAVDGIVIGLLGLLLVGIPGTLPPAVQTTVMAFSGWLILLGALLLGLMASLYYQNRRLLRGWHRATRLLNTQLQNSFRFKLWSVIYGLQKLLNRRALLRYVGYSVLMWALYLAAFAALAHYFFRADYLVNLGRSLIAFLGVSIPSGPAFLGSYQAVTDPLLQALAPGATSTNWLVISWFMLAVPVSVLGALLLARHRTKYGKLLAPSGKLSLRDKLARDEDISQELATFLDAYFSVNTLSHILHKLETKEDIKLIQYFKGGSDASTLLVHQGGQLVVKKIIPGQYAHRLKAQHDWLKQYSNFEQVVKLTHEHETKTYYAIDIEYYPEFTPFFDYIHSQNLARSQKVLRGVFNFLFEHVYVLEPKSTNEAALEAFIQSKLWGKLDQASKLNTQLARLREFETLVINGVEYPNVHRVMEVIKTSPKIWRDLATFRPSPIHGDVTVDNILTSSKVHDFKIIDPAPDQNEIAGPVFDFGRQYQSLGYGYEFLCRDDSPTVPDGNVINYEDSRSAYYRDLQTFYIEMAREMLEPEEFRAMRFHTAVLYSRVLAHRVQINPANVAKFYAISVRAFNDFLAQYDEKVPEKD